MKKKTAQVQKFIDGLHQYITSDPQFRKDTRTRSEAAIQAEIRPLILNFLTKHFADAGYADAIAKANKSFYWEGQEGIYGRERQTTFGSRNYPDFIITDPYLVAIEYKQSKSGSIVKHGVGQSIMHTLCEEFHFVYLLFHDENPDKKIEKSRGQDRESFIIDKMWRDFNVMIRFV
jgi:hypothetical protein